MKKASNRTALAVVVLSLAGCASIKGSFQSSSDSSAGSLEALASPFHSLSTSSGSGGSKTASANYRRDVRSYAVACLSRDDGERELLRGIGRIAELHGISDWEADPNTLAAVHDVVASGDLDHDEVARLRAGLAPLGPTALETAFGAEGSR